MHKKIDPVVIFILIFVLTLLACQVAPTPTQPSEMPALASATETVEKTEEPDPSPTSTSEPQVLVYQPNPDLPDSLNRLIEEQSLVQAQGSTNDIAYSFDFGDSNRVGNWVYALVAPFPTFTDEVSFTWLQNLWKGEPEDENQRLLIAEGDLPALTSILGEPGQRVVTHAKEDLLEKAWTIQNTWAIIPFEEIEPRWKVIAIDGQSPIHKDFSADQYPLTIPISLNPVIADDNFSSPAELEDLYFSNLDPGKITTVMLTGVTALVRATAVGMDQRGILVPGKPRPRDARG